MEKVYSVVAHPKSSKRCVVADARGLHVYFKVSPTNGAANLELIKLLSEYFGVGKTSVKIIRGHSSRQKLVKVDC